LNTYADNQNTPNLVLSCLFAVMVIALFCQPCPGAQDGAIDLEFSHPRIDFESIDNDSNTFDGKLVPLVARPGELGVEYWRQNETARRTYSLEGVASRVLNRIAADSHQIWVARDYIGAEFPWRVDVDGDDMYMDVRVDTKNKIKDVKVYGRMRPNGRDTPEEPFELRVVNENGGRLMSGLSPFKIPIGPITSADQKSLWLATYDGASPVWGEVIPLAIHRPLGAIPNVEVAVSDSLREIVKQSGRSFRSYWVSIMDLKRGTFEDVLEDDSHELIREVELDGRDFERLVRSRFNYELSKLSRLNDSDKAAILALDLFEDRRFKLLGLEIGRRAWNRLNSMDDLADRLRFFERLSDFEKHYLRLHDLKLKNTSRFGEPGPYHHRLDGLGINNSSRIKPTGPLLFGEGESISDCPYGLIAEN